MSAFDTYRSMRDSTLRNGENARAEQTQQNALMARQNAGSLIAGGDTTGGANALLMAGEIAPGMAVSANARQAQEDAQERHLATLVAGAQGLRRLPAEQRWQAYQSRVLPFLQQEGLDANVIGQITQDVMDDASLDSVILMAGGEAEQPRYLQGQRGALDAIDPYTGALTSVRGAAREEPPNGYRWAEDGATLIPIPGGPADPRQVGAIAGSRRAPRRGGGGGGRSSGSRPTSPAPSGGSSLPPGFVVR